MMVALNKAENPQDVEKVFKGSWANLERRMLVPVSQAAGLGLSVIIIQGFGSRVALPDKSRADFMYWQRFIKIKFLNGIFYKVNISGI